MNGSSCPLLSLSESNPYSNPLTYSRGYFQLYIRNTLLDDELEEETLNETDDSEESELTSEEEEILVELFRMPNDSLDKALSNTEVMMTGMRVNGADSVTTAALIRNTPEVNKNFYTYDVSESDYKKELIRKASLCG